MSKLRGWYTPEYRERLIELAMGGGHGRGASGRRNDTGDARRAAGP